MSQSSAAVNQLAFVVVSERQAGDLLQALVKERFQFTKIDSAGLIFQEPTLCLLVGLHNTNLKKLVALITEYCQPYQEYIPAQFNPSAGLPRLSMIEARAGGALVYLLDVERFEHI
jgi:uncharacterized protein YaaQ